MIKLIAFDLWKTLIYRDVSYSTTSKMLDETGSKISKIQIAKLFEKTIQTKKWISKKQAYRELCIKMGLCKKKNLKDDEIYIKKLMNIREQAEEKIKEYPHTIPMLKNLKQQGFKIGLITNSSHFAIEKVKKKTNIFKYIDYSIFPFEVGVIKPDPKMFETILKISKCKPTEVIMIGDSKKDDVIPPRKIGMHSIHYTNYENLKKELEKYGVFI